jgi:hypothetical protein
MNRTEIEGHVKERFNMGLLEFMKQKIEEESLYDYEIAGQLNVNPQTIGMWREVFNLRRTNGFLRHFEKKYGEGAAGQFKKLAVDPNTSLTDVGRYFGFTREYARQVYMKIFGRPYTLAYYEKRRRRKGEINSSVPAQRPSALLTKTLAKMASMGLEYESHLAGDCRSISVNGYRIKLRFSSPSYLIGGKRNYKMNTKSVHRMSACDFLICVLSTWTEDFHYVIPAEELPKCSLSLSPDSGIHDSKYARFREAWHLLRQKRCTP